MDADSMSILDLRKELQLRGLDTKGKKPQLVQRLKDSNNNNNNDGNSSGSNNNGNNSKPKRSNPNAKKREGSDTKPATEDEVDVDGEVDVEDVGDDETTSLTEKTKKTSTKTKPTAAATTATTATTTTTTAAATTVATTTAAAATITTTPTTTPGTNSEDPVKTKATVALSLSSVGSLSDEEKIKHRMERFNFKRPLTDEEKIEQRMERFNMKRKLTEEEKIAKRNTRFGITTEDDKRSKRLKRFGSSSNPASSPSLLVRSDKSRAERLGFTLQGKKQLSKEKKEARAKRFAKVELDNGTKKAKIVFATISTTPTLSLHNTDNQNDGSDEELKKKQRIERFKKQSLQQPTTLTSEASN